MRLSKTVLTSNASINNSFISDFIEQFCLFLALFASAIMWRNLAIPICGFNVWEDCSFQGALQRCVFSCDIVQVEHRFTLAGIMMAFSCSFPRVFAVAVP